MIPQEQEILTWMLDPVFYDRNVPSVEAGRVLYVNITLNALRLISMDQQQETIIFQDEFIVMWFDPSLGWDPMMFPNYPGEYVNVPYKQVWIPDIIYYNTIDQEKVLLDEWTYVNVKYNGWVRASVTATRTLPCELHLADFPYDQQKCDLYLGSWIFDESMLKLHPTATDFQPDAGVLAGENSGQISYFGNSEWDLRKIDARLTSKAYLQTGYTDLNYSLILFHLHLERRPVYYVMIIQMPTLIFGVLTIFGMFTPFSQRRERWQKAELGLNMLLAISMLLNLLSSMMPKVERLPLLGNYIVAQIFICAVGTVVSITLLEIHTRADQRNWRPPDFCCRFLLLSCVTDKKKTSALFDTPLTIPPLQTTEFEIGNTAACQARKQLHQTLHLVRSFITRTQAEEEWKLIWTKIFDRLDIVGLVVFQSSNIIVAAMFMR